MQTFLPYPNFLASAMVLDYKRLGKQRVEAHQILKALAGDHSRVPHEPQSFLPIQKTPPKKSGWSNHPAVKMWRGYEQALMLYADVMVRQWMRLGFRNTMPLHWERIEDIPKNILMPHWLGDHAFHAAHRSQLMYKDMSYYKNTWKWTDPVRLPYIWPEGRA